MFYEAFAESVIRYGLIIYGNALKTILSSIDSAQRRILRAIYFKQIWLLSQIYSTKCLTNVYEMFIHEVFIEVFKQIRGESPNEFLKFNYNHHNYNTTRKRTGFFQNMYQLFQRELFWKREALKMSYQRLIIGRSWWVWYRKISRGTANKKLKCTLIKW